GGEQPVGRRARVLPTARAPRHASRAALGRHARSGVSHQAAAGPRAGGGCPRRGDPLARGGGRQPLRRASRVHAHALASRHPVGACYHAVAACLDAAARAGPPWEAADRRRWGTRSDAAHPGACTAVVRRFQDGHEETWWAVDREVGAALGRSAPTAWWWR